MFIKFIALGTIFLQIAILAFVVLWLTKNKILKKIQKNSHIIIAVIFIASALGSLTLEYFYGFEPCLLCWYQRIAIFGIAILSLTSDIRTNKVLQKQIIIFSALGIVVALVHNYIDIFPTGLDICGTGPSCLKRYIYEFGYITIPMMSLTSLVCGFLLSIFNRKYKA